jgi:hypothetical protein
MNTIADAKTSDQLEKKRKRLERNRESARECRKRKKEKKLMLRQQLAMLEADNLQLRLKLQVGHETNNKEEKSQYISSKLQTIMKEGATDLQIHEAIAEYQERFSDYGRDRRSAIDFHVTQLRRCLQPTQTTRAILWLMGVARQFHGPNNAENGGSPELAALWASIMQEIKPTPEQNRLMVSYTTDNDGVDPFEAINDVTKTCNGMLDRLVEIICNKNNSLDTEMSNIQAILSARQIAKFILWIDQNPACMQMLEALWPHIAHGGASSSGSSGNLRSGSNDNMDGEEGEADNDSEDDDDYSSSDNDNA